MRDVLAIGAAVVAVLGSTGFSAEDASSCSRNTIEFEGRKWTHDGADRVSVEEYRGKTALLMRGGHAGSVYLPDAEFQDGTIEVDIASLGRSTPGIGFRGRDNGNWHNTILFNRRLARDGEDEDVVEQAVVTRRTGTVLLLNIRQSGRGAARGSPNASDWYHVKVVVQGGKVQVYLNRSASPSVEVGAMLDRHEKGVLGLCGGGGEGFCFANYRYTTAEDERTR